MRQVFLGGELCVVKGARSFRAVGGVGRVGQRAMGSRLSGAIGAGERSDGRAGCNDQHRDGRCFRDTDRARS